MSALITLLAFRAGNPNLCLENGSWAQHHEPATYSNQQDNSNPGVFSMFLLSSKLEQGPRGEHSMDHSLGSLPSDQGGIAHWDMQPHTPSPYVSRLTITPSPLPGQGNTCSYQVTIHLLHQGRLVLIPVTWAMVTSLPFWKTVVRMGGEVHPPCFFHTPIKGEPCTHLTLFIH